MINTYTFAIMPWGFERQATAETEKQARKAVWDSLTDEQRNGCECLDCVEEEAAL